MISLIIPTCSSMDVLQDTLESVLAQLPEDGELVIVDDGSDDGTEDILAAVQKKLQNPGRLGSLLYDPAEIHPDVLSGLSVQPGDDGEFL